MSWFRKSKPTGGPDFSAVTSQEAAARLAKKGELVPTLLLPTQFGGDDHPGNVVFVPPFAAELKVRTDQNIVAPLAAQGKITRYKAEPSYSGKSFVPVAITVKAYDPGDFTQTIAIWGDALNS